MYIELENDRERERQRQTYGHKGASSIHKSQAILCPLFGFSLLSSLLSLLCLTFSYFSNVDSLTRFATLSALL